MAYINTYAEELLLDFYDAVHFELSRVLQTSFGEDWIQLGICCCPANMSPQMKSEFVTPG